MLRHPPRSTRTHPLFTTRLSSDLLVDYRAALERFIRRAPLLVLPGHGPRCQDVPALTEAMRHHHDSRADEILEVIRRLGEATPYELSGEMSPHTRDFSTMPGAAEVVGPLDLLEDDRKLVRRGHPHRSTRERPPPPRPNTPSRPQNPPLPT